MKWSRGDLSFIFDGESALDSKTLSLLVLDNQSKEYQKIKLLGSVRKENSRHLSPSVYLSVPTKIFISFFSMVYHVYYYMYFSLFPASIICHLLFPAIAQDDINSDVKEHVRMLMSRPIVYANMSTQPIVVTRAQSGWFFREDKSVSVCVPVYVCACVCACLCV